MIAATSITPSSPMTEPLPSTLTLTGTIRDFTPDHPDFEKDPDHSGGYGPDKGIVKPVLGSDRKPVFMDQRSPTGNWTTTKENFDQWYRLDAPNRTKSCSLTLTRNPGSNVYTFDSDIDPLFKARGGFFPIDNELAGNTPGYAHNYHFTYEVHYEFTYQPGQVFKFRGDDDLWVFINHQLVIDLGGVHEALPAEVNLDTLGLVSGHTYAFDLFYAERHTTEANFRVETSIVFPPTAQVIASVPQAHKVGASNGEFTITLDRPASQALTVPYTIAGTAIAGTDYQPLSGTVTFAPGVVSQKIPVQPLGTPPPGLSSATVMVTLQLGTGYNVNNASATVTIADQVIIPSTVQVIASVPQAHKVGPSSGEFTVSLDRAANQALTVPYAIAGTAIAGTDYQALSGSVTFAPGLVSQKISVQPLGTPPPGLSSATVSVTLQPGLDYHVGNASATVTITDQVIIPSTVQVIASMPQAHKVGPSNGEFTVSLDRPASQALTVPYTMAGTAIAGTDYQPLSGSVTFPAGVVSQKISVLPLGTPPSGLSSATVSVALQAGSGYNLGNANATVTITDQVEKAIAHITTTRAEMWRPRPGSAATELGEFSIRLTKPTTADLTIAYQISGTAVAGTDYQAVAGNVVLSAGHSTVAVPIVPLATTRLRADRLTVIATLVASTAYDLGTNAATVVVRGPRSVGGGGVQG